MLCYDVKIPYERLEGKYFWAAFDGDYLEENFRRWICEIAPSGWIWTTKSDGIIFCFCDEREAMQFKLSC